MWTIGRSQRVEEKNIDLSSVKYGKRKVYLYDRADFSSYREQLSQVNFDNLFASDDIDSITRSIVKIFINEVDKAIPNRILE
jgi:hypothetical protein